MTRYILSLIAALFITLSSFAQGSLPSRFNVSYLNMAAGMPNNFADDIFQDSYGFVWISTHGGGLVRYDGFNYMNFNLGSSGISLRSNSCRNKCGVGVGNMTFFIRRRKQRRFIVKCVLNLCNGHVTFHRGPMMLCIIHTKIPAMKSGDIRNLF